MDTEMIKHLSVAQPSLMGNEMTYVMEALRRNELAGGSFLGLFETEFARLCGVTHAITAMNGTAALHLAMLAKDLKPGDEVIMPALTYVATANAVRYCGATPVFCDVDPLNWCITADRVREKITPRTVGIIPVHLYGFVADMTALQNLSIEFGLWMVEDAAEAHGAVYGPKAVGSLSDIGVFSFYGNKILTCGEGGMLTTDDDALAAKIRLYRGQGVDTSIHRYHHTVVGYNYRMTNVQAAIGLAQLENITRLTARRNGVAQLYLNKLSPYFGSQAPLMGTTTANWMFSILVPEHVNRDLVITRLAERGIETRPTFRCMHQLPIYETEQTFPVAEDISARGINLPTHASLTHTDVARVCEAVLEEAR